MKKHTPLAKLRPLVVATFLSCHVWRPQNPPVWPDMVRVEVVSVSVDCDPGGGGYTVRAQARLPDAAPATRFRVLAQRQSMLGFVGPDLPSKGAWKPVLVLVTGRGRDAPPARGGGGVAIRGSEPFDLVVPLEPTGTPVLNVDNVLALPFVRVSAGLIVEEATLRHEAIATFAFQELACMPALKG